MKRLIAQRQVQYMGRTYERGASIPADDPKMVSAWLNAKSAAWKEDSPDGVSESNAAAGMLTGHLDREDLLTMKKADLENLAKDMGISMLRDASKEQIADLIVAEEVQAPMDGGIQ